MTAMMDETEMMGEVLEQRTIDGSLDVEKSDETYGAHTIHDSLHGDVLNFNGTAAAMTQDSKLELGGTNTKRVTQTRALGEHYLYVETES
jgi:hypothetical protein